MSAKGSESDLRKIRKILENDGRSDISLIHDPAESEYSENEGDGSPYQVSESLCDALSYASQKGKSASQMARELPLCIDTILYHVNNKCSHKSNGHVTEKHCEVIREMAHDGLKYTKIDSMMSGCPSAEVARWHASGECQCDVPVEPVERRRQEFVDQELCDKIHETYSDDMTHQDVADELEITRRKVRYHLNGCSHQ